MIRDEKRKLVVQLTSGLTKDEWQRIKSRIDALFEKRALKLALEGEEATVDHLLKDEWDLTIPERSESSKD